MANSRMYLTCKHCGKQLFLAKGYYGEYGTRAGKNSYLTKTCEEYVDILEDFFDNHGGMCKKATHMVDNARDHYIILEEGEYFDYEEYGKTGEEIILNCFEKIHNEYKCVNNCVTPKFLGLTDKKELNRLFYDGEEVYK